MGRGQTLRLLARLSGFAREGAPRVADETLADAAFTEQIAPLLGARIVRGELEGEPRARTRLVQAYLACLATDEWAAAARAPLLAALRRRGIPTMLLKGGALVRTVYVGPGRRLMADLDLLVPTPWWAEAQVALAAAGGVLQPALTLASGSRFYHERTYRTRAGALIDLHRTVTAWPLFRIDHAAMFARALMVEEGAVGLLVPAPEDLFISLVVHAAQDGYALPLRAVIDGMALAASGTLDSAALVARAREWGAARATATWLHVLLAHGLEPSPWAEVAAALAGQAAARAAADLPHPVPRDTRSEAAGRWNARWQLVRAHDAPARPLVFLAYRAALRAGDRVRARLPHLR